MERDLQERLYSLLELLNMIHPPSEEYKAIFKKDMFAKSNKVAFFQVVHYLLHILNPEKAKEKLITWPTCNIKLRENKFRGEVFQFLNELNSIYEDANLPVMMSSHLLAPGGYRFIHFMYRLTVLVSYEDLEREYPDEIFMPPRPGKNDDLNSKMHENLLRINENISYEINCAVKTFDKKFELFKREAEGIVSESNVIDAEMKKIQENIESELHVFKDHEMSNEQILEDIETLQEKSKIIDKINDINTECKSLMSHLVEFNESGEPLNLIQSIQDLNISLKKKLSDLPIYTLPELELYLEQISQKNDGLELMDKRLRDEQESLQEAMRISKDLLKNNTTDVEN